MNWLQNLLPDNLTYALGWTVVHSLWQGTLIAAIMALLLMALKNKTANMRYWIANGALLFLFLSAATTFVWLLNARAETGNIQQNWLFLLRGSAYASNEANQNFIYTISTFFNRHLSIIVLMWLIGVAFFALRMAGGLMYIEILKTRHLTPLSSAWQARMHVFKNSLFIRKTVVLVESALISVPMTIGWLKPIILLPIGAVNGMTVGQVEAILAHELAHIQAKDYILNIFQTLVEILFYYHPAAWWISANIRAERENRCDDVAVRLCGNSLTYAKALLALQEMQHQNVRTYGLAMTFSTKRKGILLKRVKRILNQPQNRSNIMEKLTATGLLLAVVAAFAFADKPHNQNSAPKSIFNEKAPPSVKEAFFNDFTDTIPKRKGNLTIKREDNGKSIEMQIHDGEITNLKIDGQEIPKSDYDKYGDVTDDLLYNLPTPPAPPAPPAFGTPPAPPAPPTPPAFGTPPAPPVPPTPPMPPTPPSRQRLGIIKGKDKEGNTLLKLEQGSGKTSEIIMRDGEIYVDGEKLEKRKDLALDLFQNKDFDMDIRKHILDKTNDLKLQFFIKDFTNDFRILKGHEDLLNNKNFKFHNQENALKQFYFLDSKDRQFMANDSTDVFKFKNKLKYKIKLNNDNSKRMIADWRQQSIKMREEAKRIQKEALRFQKEAQGKYLLMDIEKMRLDSSTMPLLFQKEGWHERPAVEAMEKIGNELIKDGYIKSGERFDIDFSDKALIINGKVLPNDVLEKYLKFTEDFVKMNGNNGKRSFQIKAKGLIFPCK